MCTALERIRGKRMRIDQNIFESSHAISNSLLDKINKERIGGYMQNFATLLKNYMYVCIIESKPTRFQNKWGSCVDTVTLNEFIKKKTERKSKMSVTGEGRHKKTRMRMNTCSLSDRRGQVKGSGRKRREEKENDWWKWLSSGTREWDRRSHTMQMQRERSAIHDESGHQQYESGAEWTGVEYKYDEFRCTT